MDKNAKKLSILLGVGMPKNNSMMSSSMPAMKKTSKMAKKKTTKKGKKKGTKKVNPYMGK